jgi:hypothetical protein
MPETRTYKGCKVTVTITPQADRSFYTVYKIEPESEEARRAYGGKWQAVARSETHRKIPAIEVPDQAGEVLGFTFGLAFGEIDLIYSLGQ